MSPDRVSFGIDPAMVAGLSHHLGITLIPIRIIGAPCQGGDQVDRDECIAFVEKRDSWPGLRSGSGIGMQHQLELAAAPVPAPWRMLARLAAGSPMPAARRAARLEN